MPELLKYTDRKERLLASASAVFVAFHVWFSLKLPDFMSEVTVLVKTPGNSMESILSAGLYMLLCAFAAGAASIASAVFASRLGADFAEKLRRLQFEKVQTFSAAEMNSFSIASLITRSTNDVMQIQMFISRGLRMFLRAPLSAAWAVAKIVGKGGEWTLATMLAVAAMFTMMIFIFAFALPKFKRIQILTDNLTRIVRENLLGLRVIRAYNAEDYQTEKFERANEELTTNNLFTYRVMGIMHPGMQTVMNLLSLSIYWIGAGLIAVAAGVDKIVLFSDMVVFMNYAIHVVMSFMALSVSLIMLPRVTISADRIMEVLKTEPSVAESEPSGGAEPGLPVFGSADGEVLGLPVFGSADGEGLELPAFRAAGRGLPAGIEFRNVSFRYPGASECVLEDISFRAEAGRTTAFIGATGSGKSTLLNLIMRLYDTTKGEILIDGIDVKDYPVEELNEKFGYVPQTSVIFSGTIRSNVAYPESGEGREEDIATALQVAQATDFVESLEERDLYPVARGGTNLSGGQKQRLSIARAVYRDPEIYIFDDSFSALDYKTDTDLRRALKVHASKATKLIVAQRIGTILEADRIVVLDEGRIVGSGTHSELMENCEIYRQIAFSQLSKAEMGI